VIDSRHFSDYSFFQARDTVGRETILSNLRAVVVASSFSSIVMQPGEPIAQSARLTDPSDLPFSGGEPIRGRRRFQIDAQRAAG
jgi:hypothetical protein